MCEGTPSNTLYINFLPGGRGVVCCVRENKIITLLQVASVVYAAVFIVASGVQVRRRAHEARADVNNSIQHKSAVHFHTIAKDVKESVSKVSEAAHLQLIQHILMGAKRPVTQEKALRWSCAKCTTDGIIL